SCSSPLPPPPSSPLFPYTTLFRSLLPCGRIFPLCRDLPAGRVESAQSEYRVRQQCAPTAASDRSSHCQCTSGLVILVLRRRDADSRVRHRVLGWHKTAHGGMSRLASSRVA